MKRWYDTQIGVPLSHAAVTNRLSITANFAGNTALQASPYDRLPATAFFAGASSFIADLTGRIIPATAAFSATSALSLAAPYKQLIAAATFAGASTASATARMAQAANANYAASTNLSASMLLWHRLAAVANFSGASALSANLTLVGRLQATAQFAGASAVALTNIRQRMMAVAKFAATSQFSYSPRLRMAAIAKFAGAGVYNATGNIVPPESISPNAPTLTLVSSPADVTPDFSVGLPSGAGNQTDAQIGDIVVIEYTNNPADIPATVWQASARFDGSSSVFTNPTVIPAGGSTVTGWQQLRIGAGGWCTSIDIHADGTKVVRTDTYGAYIYNKNIPNPGNAGGTGCWQPLCTVDRLGANNIGRSSVVGNEIAGGSGGCVDIRIAPSNSSIIYMYFQSRIWKSVDQGATFTLTAFGPIFSDPNLNVGTIRYMSCKMAIDPANPNIVYCTTDNNGLYVTSNGGTSWTSVPAVGTGASFGGHAIAFDRTSAVVGGATQTIYVHTNDVGAYRSTNGGTSWTSIGGPAHHGNMICDKFGQLWVGTGSALMKYSGGAWSTSPTNGASPYSVTVDPNAAAAATQRMVIESQNTFELSANGGTTWLGLSMNDTSPDMVKTCTDIPWMVSPQQSMSVGNIFWDKVDGNVWFGMGIGVFCFTPDFNYKGHLSQPWLYDPGFFSVSSGIEQLVGVDVITPPGDVALVVAEDRSIFRVDNPDVYPSYYGPHYPQPSIDTGWGADWATGAPNVIVINALFWNEISSRSTDGGHTWTKFGSVPPGGSMGGTIAAGSATNYVMNRGARSPLYYTNNSGATWTACSIPGATQSWGPGTQWALDKPFCADKVTQNTYYAYDYISQAVYRSIDGGANWTTRKAINLGFGNSIRLTAVPTQAGHLFYIGGPSNAFPHPSTQPLWRSTDGGSNWSTVTGMLELSGIGFGLHAPGQSYPAIYVTGFFNGVYGVWQSIDNCVSWTNIGDYPYGNADLVACCTGDANTFGVVYVGFHGSGFAIRRP